MTSRVDHVSQRWRYLALSCLCLVAAAAQASSTPPTNEDRTWSGWIDLNIGFDSPNDNSLAVEGEAIDPRTVPPQPWPGSGGFNDEYRFGTDETYGIAGGVLAPLSAVGRIGVGLRVMRSRYTADIASEWVLEDPNNIGLGIFNSDRFEAAAPDRRETAWHLHAVYELPLGDRLRDNISVRVLAGPTRFQAKLPITNGIGDMDTFTQPWRFRILELNHVMQRQTVTGAHLGADVAWYFSESIGLVGSWLYSRGSADFTVSPPDATGDPVREKIRLGGHATTIGLRIRF